MKIHLSRLNYSSSIAMMSSITLRPANNKFGFLALFFFSNICINRVIRLDQMVLNILFSTVCDNLIIRTLMQNRIKIRRAGCDVSPYLITSFRLSNSDLSLCSYWSTLPA